MSVCVKQKLCAGNYYFFPFFLPRVHPGSRTGVEGCPHSHGDGSRRCRRAEALVASSPREPPATVAGAGSEAPARRWLDGASPGLSRRWPKDASRCDVSQQEKPCHQTFAVSTCRSPYPAVHAPRGLPVPSRRKNDLPALAEPRRHPPRLGDGAPDSVSPAPVFAALLPLVSCFIFYFLFFCLSKVPEITAVSHGPDLGVGAAGSPVRVQGDVGRMRGISGGPPFRLLFPEPRSWYFSIFFFFFEICVVLFPALAGCYVYLGEVQGESGARFCSRVFRLNESAAQRVVRGASPAASPGLWTSHEARRTRCGPHPRYTSETLWSGVPHVLISIS